MQMGQFLGLKACGSNSKKRIAALSSNPKSAGAVLFSDGKSVVSALKQEVYTATPLSRGISLLPSPRFRILGCCGQVHVRPNATVACKIVLSTSSLSYMGPGTKECRKALALYSFFVSAAWLLYWSGFCSRFGACLGAWLVLLGRWGDLGAFARELARLEVKELLA
jgi:hypothetical protein